MSLDGHSLHLPAASLSSFSLSRRCVLVRRLFRLSSFTNRVAPPLSREEDAAVWSIPLTMVHWPDSPTIQHPGETFSTRESYSERLGWQSKSVTTSTKAETRVESVDASRQQHTRRNAHLFEFAAGHIGENVIHGTRRMMKGETGSRHATGDSNLFSVAKVEKEDDVVTVINDREATTIMDTKVVGAGSIQSLDEVYETLATKVPRMMAIGLAVRSLAEQVHSLDEHRRKNFGERRWKRSEQPFARTSNRQGGASARTGKTFVISRTNPLFFLVSMNPVPARSVP